MKKTRQNGFVLMLVIAAMAVIGAEIFFLSRDSNTVLFQTNEVYLEACEQNLIASGLVWAKQNAGNGNAEFFNKKIELNTGDLDVKNATLSITMGAPVNKEAKVQINTSCQRGRRILRHSGEYRIRL